MVLIVQQTGFGGRLMERLVKVSIVHGLWGFFSRWGLSILMTRRVRNCHWGPDLAAQHKWIRGAGHLANLLLPLFSILEESLTTRSQLKSWSIQPLPAIFFTRRSGHTLLRSLC